MTRILVVSLLGLASLMCLVGAWIENRRWTRELDRSGAEHGCKRWPGETNNHYHMRLRARIGLS
ncbi:MAG TPA: hypothetical protein VFZ00_11315 [Solirubrobacter sp.]|nr:hypothetical protein [Solirubrobacter sp.]